MKLRNKKTGETIETDYMFGVSVPTTKTFGCKSYDQIAAYSSLAELNEEWEDYEEPKEYWYIDCDGEVYSTDRLNGFDLDRMMNIGNRFNSREEAEKVVEKLKAWKRLKDNGYEFNGIGVEYDGYKIHLKCNIMKKEHYTPTQDHKDLDLLFGGEE